jgi:hypothetical protein
MSVLGYDLYARPMRGGPSGPWLQRVKFIDPTWNSIPHWARSDHLRINHWGGVPVDARRELTLDDLARTVVQRLPSEPAVGTTSRQDLPGLFNRLGLIGVGLVERSIIPELSPWMLHRWKGGRLISVTDGDNRRALELLDIV